MNDTDEAGSHAPLDRPRPARIIAATMTPAVFGFVFTRSKGAGGRVM
jgi:hypothetical protein